eukprot:scaffold5.g778.t1
MCRVGAGSAQTPPRRARGPHPPSPRPPSLRQWLVWSTWAVIAVLWGAILLSYNFFPDYSSRESWQARCRCLGVVCCCCLPRRPQEEGRHERLSARLGALMASVFGHVDMTPSDAICAFTLAMLLQRMQRRAQREGKGLGAEGGPEAAGRVSEGQDGADAGASPAAAGGAAGAAGAGGGGERAAARLPGGRGQAQSDIQLSAQSSPSSRLSACSSMEPLLAPGGGSDMGAQEDGAGPPAPGAAGAPGGAAWQAGQQQQQRGGVGRGPQQGQQGQQQGQQPGQQPGQQGQQGQQGPRGERGGGAASPAELAAMESFLPRRPAGGATAVGAEKTEEAPGHRPARGDSRVGERGPVDAATLAQAAYWMKYAFAAYGYLLYIWHKPVTGIADLCCGRSCGLLFGAARGRRKERRLDLRVRDVLPYYIAVDHNAKAVVVAIRGTLSLEDTVRDLLFEPASLEEWAAEGAAAASWHDPPPPVALTSQRRRGGGAGGGAGGGRESPAGGAEGGAGVAGGGAAHAGILEAARGTLGDLQTRGVLWDLLLAGSAPCAGYRLVLTGHSLGAGCAFLLALRLRRVLPRAQAAAISCWCFSPPGGLVSRGVGAAAAEWCTSVVVGREWIPRLSLATFDRMRDEVVFAALRCRLPKWRLLLGFATGRRWTEQELFFHSCDEVGVHGSVAVVVWVAGEFGPPGRCIYLRPTGVKLALPGREGRRRRWGRTQRRRQYKAVWIDGQALISEGILISGRMMADHMARAGGHAFACASALCVLHLHRGAFGIAVPAPQPGALGALEVDRVSQQAEAVRGGAGQGDGGGGSGDADGSGELPV